MGCLLLYNSNQLNIVNWRKMCLIVMLLCQHLPSAVPHNFKDPKQISRKEELHQRYAAGESVPSLAQAYGISEQRVHQILQGKRK
jgi:hypothetical protein